MEEESLNNQIGMKQSRGEPVTTQGGTRLVTDCNYFPLSIFIYNSVLNYEFINKSFLFDVVNNLNYIMDVPMSIVYPSLYSSYESLYNKLILPWTFNQIIELYGTYVKSFKNSNELTQESGSHSVETNNNNTQIKNVHDLSKLVTKEHIDTLVSHKPSIKKHSTLMSNILQSKSFFPHIDRDNLYYVTSCEEYINHVTPQITKFKLLEDEFIRFTEKISKKVTQFEYSDEKAIYTILKNEWKLQNDINK